MSDHREADNVRGCVRPQIGPTFDDKESCTKPYDLPRSARTLVGLPTSVATSWGSGHRQNQAPSQKQISVRHDQHHQINYLTYCTVIWAMCTCRTDVYIAARRGFTFNGWPAPCMSVFSGLLDLWLEK